MNQAIILLENDKSYTSLKLNESDLWFSGDKYDSIQKMEEVVKARNGKGLKSHGIIPYDQISQIKLNDESQKVKVDYTNIKGKDTQDRWEFPSVQDALQFGEILGSKAGLLRSTNQENSTKTLLMNLLWPIGIMAFAVFAAMNPGYETSGNSRSSRKSNFVFMIIRLLHDKIGAIGVMVVGGLLSALLIFSAIKRMKNPANDIIFSKMA